MLKHRLMCAHRPFGASFVSVRFERGSGVIA
jgi:hypothetical protein